MKPSLPFSSCSSDSLFSKASSLKGVTIAEREVIISQLADDTTLFLKDESQISLAINIID